MKFLRWRKLGQAIEVCHLHVLLALRRMLITLSSNQAVNARRDALITA